MFKYYVNRRTQANGDHEVHKEGCAFMPDPENRIYLGNFYFCREAVRESKIHFSQTNGCYYCSNECHAK